MVERRDGRRAVPALETIPYGAIRGSRERIRADIDKANPDRNWGLGICKVVNIDYEEFQVSLRQLTGASDDYERIPVPMTFPGCGNRHFFGAMPEIGDLCFVGWQVQESSRPEDTRTPIILAWLLPGVWPGREWMITAGLTDDEFDLSTEKNRKIVEGVHDRIRHKLRHCQPGNIVASSSQGSDLVLDEGVTLANRRSNEIRLRDQDQAFVTRALQNFHAMSGARVYGGMIQRDALLLATTMVSDGKLWDGPLQANFREPLSDQELPPDTANPPDFLTPPRPFNRAIQDDEEQPLGNSLNTLDPHLDPYTFLLRGGFINTEGFVVDSEKHRADAVYGGKGMFRVAASGTNNAVLDPSQPTLTEYRIEIAHTADGRLPVSEQTDMFDAERLPPTDPESGGPRTKLPPNAPFIESVLGSVVGNDPYSQQGKLRYGVPLVPIIFDGDIPGPRLAPARLIARPDSGDTPTPVAEHAATLLRVTPPVATGASPDTFWSVNKKGQFRVALAGPQSENSLEAALLGGLKLSVGGEFKLLLTSGVSLGSRQGDKDNNIGLNLGSDSGAVKIYGGGKLKGAEAVAQRNSPIEGGESDTPSVDIHARMSARLRAEKKVLIKGNVAEVNASKVLLNGHQAVSLTSADTVGISAKVIQRTANGKATDAYTGPKDLLPTAGALHEVTYTPTLPGINAQEVDFTMGDRVETFTLGNHSTEITVGNMTYKTLVGSWTAGAGVNTLELSDTNGLSGTISVGNLSLSAVGGTAEVSGVAGATVKATGGLGKLSGTAGIQLGAPVTGPDQGSIICSGSLEPFTGLPYSTWGMGAKAHNVVSS